MKIERHVARVDVMLAVLAGQQGVDGDGPEPSWPPVQHEYVHDPLEEREQRQHRDRNQRIGELPVADDDPRRQRRPNATPIIHGDGCLQNSRTASASVKPRR